MPLFRATIEKFHSVTAEYWTNVYWVEASDLPSAAAAASAIAAFERPLYPSEMMITKSRVDDGTPDTEVSSTTVHNFLGSKTYSEYNQIPLFVVARVDFSTIGGGRPSRKYLRGTYDENETNMNTLATAAITRLQTYVAGMLTLPFVDVDGQEFSAGAVWPMPAMRQLRRGSKKKVVP